jgi:putative acetyltransferase
MHGNSPPGQVHAFALEGLRRPEISFWTAWCEGALAGWAR